MQDLLDFEFDHKYMMRGLIIDKKRGKCVEDGPPQVRENCLPMALRSCRREERLATYALQRVSSVGKLLLQHSSPFTVTWTRIN